MSNGTYYGVLNYTGRLWWFVFDGGKITKSGDSHYIIINPEDLGLNSVYGGGPHFRTIMHLPLTEIKVNLPMYRSGKNSPLTLIYFDKRRLNSTVHKIKIKKTSIT